MRWVSKFGMLVATGHPREAIGSKEYGEWVVSFKRKDA